MKHQQVSKKKLHRRSEGTPYGSRGRRDEEDREPWSVAHGHRRGFADNLAEEFPKKP
jgi:hypothetical protein